MVWVVCWGRGDFCDVQEAGESFIEEEGGGGGGGGLDSREPELLPLVYEV